MTLNLLFFKNSTPCRRPTQHRLPSWARGLVAVVPLALLPWPSALLHSMVAGLNAGFVSLLLLLTETASPAAGGGGAPPVNCSATIDVLLCNCSDMDAARYPMSQCVAFGDDCRRSSGCPAYKHCQWDGLSQSCVNDKPCTGRSQQDCVCLSTPGAGSDCLWAAKNSFCTDRQPWESSGKCSAANKTVCLATGGAFGCSWGNICTMPCGGRDGGARCCEYGERCYFTRPAQPACKRAAVLDTGGDGPTQPDEALRAGKAPLSWAVVGATSPLLCGNPTAAAALLNQLLNTSIVPALNKEWKNSTQVPGAPRSCGRRIVRFLLAH